MGVIAGLTGNAVGVDTTEAQALFSNVLMDGEIVHGAFKLFRDVILLTSDRYLEIDVQAVTGAKIDYLSMPWSRVNAFSVESAGRMDLDAEMKLWVNGMGPANEEAARHGCSLSRRFAASTDVIGLQRLIADHVCR